MIRRGKSARRGKGERGNWTKRGFPFNEREKKTKVERRGYAQGWLTEKHVS